MNERKPDKTSENKPKNGLELEIGISCQDALKLKNILEQVTAASPTNESNPCYPIDPSPHVPHLNIVIKPIFKSGKSEGKDE